LHAASATMIETAKKFRSIASSVGDVARIAVGSDNSLTPDALNLPKASSSSVQAAQRTFSSFSYFDAVQILSAALSL
jgi:hypothetical protein